MLKRLFHLENGKLFWKDSPDPFPLSFTLFIATVLLYNPTFYFQPHDPWPFCMIPQESWPFLALALFMPFWKREGLPFIEKKPVGPLFYGALILYTLFSLLHIFSDFPRHGLWNLGLLLIPPALLLFFLRQGKEFSGKVFALFLLPFGAINLLLLLAPMLTKTSLRYKLGIAGNSNWTAAVLTVTFSAFIFLLYKILKKKFSLPILIGLLLPILVAGGLFWKYLNSLGSFLALLGTFFFTGILLLPRGRIRKHSVLISLLLGLLGVLTFIHFKQDAIVDRLATDERLTLWEGTINLIMENPVSGAGGSCCFENSFVPYKPLEYFFKSHNTPRTSHPHNEILYILASGGLTAGLPLLFLLLFPLFSLYISYLKKKPDSWDLLLYAMYLYFILHGSVDCFYPKYPTGLFIWMFCGYAWSRTFTEMGKSTDGLITSKEEKK